MNKKRTLNKTKLDDSDLDMFQIPNQYQRLLRKDIVHSYYEYYLNGVIGEADQYIELISALRDASPTDEFVIRINSEGGDLATALAIINAIKETQAHVVGFIEHLAASAATLIFLNCHSGGVAEDAEMMMHTSSSFYGGKEHEQFSYVSFARKKIHKLLKKHYSGFLSVEEIDRVLKGEDIYLDSDEILDRLEGFAQYQQELYLAEMEALEKEQNAVVDSTVTKKKKILLN